MQQHPQTPTDKQRKHTLCASFLEEVGLEQMWLGDRPSAEVAEVVVNIQGLSPEQLVVLRLVHSVWNETDGPNLLEMEELPESLRQKACSFLHINSA